MDKSEIMDKSGEKKSWKEKLIGENSFGKLVWKWEVMGENRSICMFLEKTFPISVKSKRGAFDPTR
jgi:hypothetical protein